MSQSYTLEPELQSRTPRRIQPRKLNIAGSLTTGAGVGCLRLFLAPFIAVGLSLIVMLLFRIVIPLVGVSTSATVTALNHTSDDDGESYTADFSYTYNGVTYNGSSHMAADVYSGMEIGQHAEAELLPLLPAFQARLTNPPGNPMFGSFRGLILFTLFWNAIIGAFVWGAFIWPGIYRRLYTEGVPAMATITNKSSSTDDGSTTYTLTYEFPVLDAASHALTQIKGNTNVTQEVWHSVRVGDAYTVLYAPHKPKWNTLYRFGTYEVVG